MPGAHDAFPIQLALIERSAIVRADVFDRKEIAIDVADKDFLTVYDDASGRAGRDVGNVSDGPHR
jgi:hypothetical protein